MSLWGKRNQQGTEPYLLCWSPSRNKTLPSNPLKPEKGKPHTILKDVIFKIHEFKINCRRNEKNPTFALGVFHLIYLLFAPVGRISRVDREIQFCCQSGWALWRPSNTETQQHTAPKAEPTRQTHKTDPLDTQSTHLSTHIDSFDFSPNRTTSYLPDASVASLTWLPAAKVFNVAK